MAQLMDRITVNPRQCGGRPCIRGMRIRVSDVLELLASGMTPKQIVREHPDLDYEREMALVLADPGRAGRAKIYGVVRLIADPDNESAEYAIVLRDEIAGHGLGTMLMNRIIAYARARDIGEIRGDVLAENKVMLAIAQKLGFALGGGPEMGEIVRVSLRLRPAA